MKKLQSLFLMLALGTFIFTTSSCKKDDPAPTPSPKTITEIVSSDANFSILKAAVVKAGLAEALSTGSLTVFAPDNAAFTASGITEATVNSLSAAELGDILKYHVLASKVNASGVPAKGSVATLLGSKIYTTSNTSGVYINGIKVKTADVAASNGVIHVISKVLTPPTKSIAELVSADPDFSLLLSAVSKAGLVAAVSDANANLTVFAPNNAAFATSGLNQAAIEGIPQGALASIVGAHVLGSREFSSDLKTGEVATIQAGASLVVSLSAAPTVLLKGSAQTASKITATDIIATNGVVHVIDRVILP